MLDPARLESQLASGTLTLTVNSQQEICVLAKMGGVPMTGDEIMRVVMTASEKVKDVDAAIKQALLRDSSQRVVEIR